MGQVRQGAREAGRSEWARKAVLAGWAAKGVVYLALAWIVLQMALGKAPQQASTKGALQLIAESTSGKIAMIVLGVGLVAYAVGRILEVTTLATAEIEGKDKAQAVVLALIYASLAISAFTIAGVAGSGGSSGGGNQEQQGTAWLLGLPGGRVIVGVVGLAFIGLGLYSAYKGGIEKGFLPTLRTGEMSSEVREWSTRLGMAAYVTKGVIFALFGWFLIQAAVTYDAQQAAGLDGALRRVADAAWGTALLVAVAVGLLAYGLFSEVEARYRRVGSSASGLA